MKWKTPKAPKPRKFLPGEALALSGEALLEIAESHKWFFYGSRPMHSAALKNMSLVTVRGFLARGSIRRADLNPDWIAFERERFARLDKASKAAIMGEVA
ncbi:hypothetical protein [Gluconobacter oxydans]|uniref:Uncharacterized protein n=1 Tax=Gluconobacter oxydans (strain 621H) TaxID=290633 RepID=Q5FN38_GLUOX|nr:hypothetical protein [Gluconobacter oxydans]AAW62209.1 Hypothetical protein GOX2478 [Gluconobacter oxydans 621H]